VAIRLGLPPRVQRRHVVQIHAEHFLCPAQTITSASAPTALAREVKSSFPPDSRAGPVMSAISISKPLSQHSDGDFASGLWC
jgi:hypothetical protein